MQSAPMVAEISSRSCMGEHMSGKKAIFITGAASGIGRATAILFGRQGWYVGLYDINEAALTELSREIGETSCCWGKLDVTSSEEVLRALEDFTAHTGGKLHALFNCAGVLTTGKFEEIPLETHHTITRVNVEGVLSCTHQAFKWLKATPGAHVVSMASASAVYGTPEYATYSASKFWIRGFTEALNIEWAPYDIQVCDILVPFVQTPLLDDDRSAAVEKLGIPNTPEEVAQAVWKAVHGSKVHWLVSAFMKLNWIVTRRVPDPIGRLIMKHICGY